MLDWTTWDAATWQAWALENWAVIALVAAGVILLLALMARAARPAYAMRHRPGEFVGTMPDRRPMGSGIPRGQTLPDRRADIIAAIDDDYASGRIDRVEWERRRTML